MDSGYGLAVKDGGKIEKYTGPKIRLKLGKTGGGYRMEGYRVFGHSIAVDPKTGEVSICYNPHD